VAEAVVIPRINANDDQLTLLDIHVAVGQSVVEGQVLAEVETSKAVVEINAPHRGVVLRIDVSAGQSVPVGEPMLWLGEDPEESLPDRPQAFSRSETDLAPAAGRRVTTKARLLLRRLGLNEEDIPSHGHELTTEDIERFASSPDFARNGGSQTAEADKSRGSVEAEADAGESIALTPWEQAMCDSLSWHRDEAVPGYLEVPLDVDGWNSCAAEIFAGRETMVSPLLGLMAHRVVEAAVRFPRANAVLVGRNYHFRRSVNLGFMVKAKKGLVMVSIANAGELDAFEFVAALSRLQRRAFAARLRPEESSGATIAFTSLAKAGAIRHIPVLPPKCSVIVAHSASNHSDPHLGITYDHRVLDGETAAEFLTFVANPLDK
jgi:pyruvate/2-oxoglutarate dehydrogenase complex dihydrolipoamide acyltransferase (E2) component